MDRNQALTIVESRDLDYIESYFDQLIEIAELDAELLSLFLEKLHFRMACLVKEYIVPFKNYWFLNMSGHKLNVLPESVWRLEQIERLDYMEGFLKEIPKEISCLTSLHTLYSSYNRISHVPKELGNLHKLQNLWLNDNKLTDLPQELSRLSELELLSLDNNLLEKCHLS
jgi:Leucine-rich repeat (LRR) protein